MCKKDTLALLRLQISKSFCYCLYAFFIQRPVNLLQAAPFLGRRGQGSDISLHPGSVQKVNHSSY